MADLRLLRRRRAAEVVEADAEPLVHLPVDGVVPVADLPRRAALLHGPGLGGRAVLVGAADEEHVVAPEAAVARVDVGAQHAPDQVAQVRHVVHVRQRARHQHVPPPLHGQHDPLLLKALLPRRRRRRLCLCHIRTLLCFAPHSQRRVPRLRGFDSPALTQNCSLYVCPPRFRLVCVFIGP